MKLTKVIKKGAKLSVILEVVDSIFNRKPF